MEGLPLLVAARKQPAGKLGMLNSLEGSCAGSPWEGQGYTAPQLDRRPGQLPTFGGEGEQMESCSLQHHQDLSSLNLCLLMDFQYFPLFST